MQPWQSSPLDSEEEEIRHFDDVEEEGHKYFKRTRRKLAIADCAKPVSQRTWFRIVIILCISFISFGSYFAYDAVSALEKKIKEDLNLSTFQFGLFYSIYSFPNIVLVIFGGMLIDCMGNRQSSLLFCSLVALGAGIVALAPSLPNGEDSTQSNTTKFIVMLFGRFIFGLGAESSYVVQNNMCVEWFHNSPHLAKAMGLTIAISRLGSITAFSSEAALANHFGSHYVVALWFAFLLCVVSLATSLLYFFLDRYAKRELARIGRLSLSVIPTKLHVNPGKAIARLPLKYWLCLFIAVTIYNTIFPFLALSGVYLSEKYDLTEEQSGLYLSIIDLTSLLTSVLFGWFVDHTGRRGLLVVVGNAIAVVAYLVLGITVAPPAVGIALLGVHSSLMPAALWPCVPLVVPTQAMQGVAFALVSAFMNAGLTVSEPIAGRIADAGGFGAMCMFFAAVSAASLVLAIVWNAVDARSSEPILNSKVATAVPMYGVQESSEEGSRRAGFWTLADGQETGTSDEDVEVFSKGESTKTEQFA